MPYLVPRPDAPEPTQTAVIVAVPAADPVVGEHRSRWDLASGLGVPAHVTVISPFLEPFQLVEEPVVDRLAAAVSTVPAFDCLFARTAWFGEDVLWLDPEPAEPFRQLTAAVWEAFPAYPPYGGAFGEPVPHLTVGELRLGSLADLQQAEREVVGRLPVSARITEALLIVGAEAIDSWRVLRTLPLG